MKTEVFRVDPDSFQPSELQRPAEILARGGLVGFPTETVYGIAASTNQPEAIHRLRELKGRPHDKPFSLHIASRDDISAVVDGVSPLAQSLIDLYWPGPLTIIFPGNAGAGIGVRLPSHVVAQELIRLSGGPIVAPSANLAGEEPAVDGAGVLEAFSGSLDAVVDSGTVALRQASTVIRLVGDDDFEILREGIITEGMIRKGLRGKRIVFVCTGNSCRSPMAEAILKSALAERLGISESELPERGYRITSAGVQAFSGGLASRHAISLMASCGLDISSHRTRSLTRTMAEEADLIIALGHSHRWQIVQWDARFADRVEVINETGVSDPIGGDLDAYQQCADEIATEIRERWIERIMSL